LIIAACFLLGIVAGRADAWPVELDTDSVSLYLIYTLLFLIGLTAGADHRTWSALRASGFKLLLPPISAVIGTFLGTIPVGLLLQNWTVGETVAVGFGLGYYSLSSVLIERIHGSELAVIALLTNVLRELSTMIVAHPLRRWFGPFAPIASGGATSSDTTLPAILAASGQQYAIPAMFNGIALTVLVPILVTLALSI
jgi:uncharacterized membrane protein YbjE (DUF340 family)